MRVLVVEDEKDVRDLMALHLKREGHDVTGVENGEEALRLLATPAFDLAVLDWMLPGVSGLEICKRIAGRMPVLMVTARADSADIVLGLEMGADDYVTKPFELPVFLARIRALLRRAQANDEPANNDKNWLEAGEIRMNMDEHRAWCGGDELKLTISEFKLLSALLANQGRVLTRDALIAQIQGADVNVVDRTVDTHVFGLRKKLGPCAEVVETIRGVGYRVGV